MPVLALRFQRLRGEFLNHWLPENHGMPKEPSSIFGHFVVGRTPPSAPGPAGPKHTSPDQTNLVPFSDSAPQRPGLVSLCAQRLRGES